MSNAVPLTNQQDTPVSPFRPVIRWYVRLFPSTPPDISGASTGGHYGPVEPRARAQCHRNTMPPQNRNPTNARNARRATTSGLSAFVRPAAPKPANHSGVAHKGNADVRAMLLAMRPHATRFTISLPQQLRANKRCSHRRRSSSRARRSSGARSGRVQAMRRARRSLAGGPTTRRLRRLPCIVPSRGLRRRRKCLEREEEDGCLGEEEVGRSQWWRLLPLRRRPCPVRLRSHRANTPAIGRGGKARGWRAGASRRRCPRPLASIRGKRPRRRTDPPDLPAMLSRSCPVRFLSPPRQRHLRRKGRYRSRLR